MTQDHICNLEYPCTCTERLERLGTSQSLVEAVTRGIYSMPIGNPEKQAEHVMIFLMEFLRNRFTPFCTGYDPALDEMMSKDQRDACKRAYEWITGEKIK